LARKQDIRLRRSATAGAVPTTTQLNLGELAINTYDGKLFLKKDVSGTETVVEIGGDSGTQQTAVYKEYVYTATNNQTSFSGSDDNSQTLSYVVGYLQVFLNGVLLENGTDYAATTGNSVVLVNGAATSDILQISTFVKVLGTGDMVTNTFTGNGSTAAYTLTANPDTEENTIVFVDGVYQEKDTYTVSGTTLTFDANVPNGASIEVIIGSRNVTTLDTADLSISGDLTVAGEAIITGDIQGDLRGATLFKGQAGEALTKGEVVYISGISGNTTVVSKADADDSAKMPAFGIVAADASINTSVSIYTFGRLSGLDTSSYSEGDELFVSTTAGALTNTAPTGESAALQKIAKVTRSDNAAGSIFIMGAGRSNAVPNLDDGDIFIGNASNQASTAALNTSIVPESGNLYFTTARVDSHLSGGTGVTYSSGTISIGQDVSTTADVQFNDVQVDGTLTSDDITSTNISVAGNATITGNLTVQGTTTSIDSNTVNIGDNIIVLNSDETGAPSQNAGIEIERGTSTNTLVRWNETSDIWEFTNDGSTYYPIATDTDDLSEGSTNLYYTDARVSTRVDTILNHSNHTNISVSKVGNELRLSAASSYGDSDVESYLDGGTSTPVLSNTDVNGTLNVSGTVSLDGTANELRFYEGSNYVGFEAPALSGDQIWVLPDSDGTAGYALKTDGSGNLSWGLAGGNAFETIAISGQSSVVADSSSDTLTLAAGTGITLTTNASTDTITITNSSLGANAFGTIAVSGQSDVDADSTSDTLTLVGQNGVAITTDASTDTVTIDGRTSYSPFTTDLFTTANASTTDFVLSVTPSSEDNLIVFLEGVYQNKNSYTLSSNTLTLDSAPASGEEVVVHIVSDLISGQSLVRNNFTGDNSTTDFTLTLAPMNENNTFVYFDGVYQEKSEYSVSGTTLSFTSAPATGDSIEVIIPKTTELQQPAVGSIDDATMYDTTVLIPQTVTATTVASTSATTIATHAAATYRTIKYLIQCTQGTDYHSTEINLIHDGTTVYITEYGTLFDNASLGTFNATISSGNILLQITPGSATSMAVKVVSSAIPV
jgi:cytoskeletal protein CcmA (bactofilin family)